MAIDDDEAAFFDEEEEAEQKPRKKEKERCEKPKGKKTKKKKEADADDDFDGLIATGKAACAAVAAAAPVRQLFRAPETTKEYEERNYYDVPSDQTTLATDLISFKPFWADYALFCLNEAKRQQDAKEKKKAFEQAAGVFLSAHLATPTSSFTEIIMALVCTVAVGRFGRCGRYYSVQSSPVRPNPTRGMVGDCCCVVLPFSRSRAWRSPPHPHLPVLCVCFIWPSIPLLLSLSDSVSWQAPLNRASE